VEKNLAAKSEYLTLDEAAEYLGFESEKSVRRLIKASKLDAELQIVKGKRRWMVSRVHLNRYRLIESNWLKRQVGGVPTFDPAEGQNLGRIFVYGEWGKPSPPRPVQCSLTVSIEDFWRFCCREFKDQHEYETIKTEIRERLPGKPKIFAVRFQFNEKEINRVLTRIINTVPPYRLPAEEWNNQQKISLRFDALEHLKKHTLPALKNAKRGWVSYLRESVKNFYRDRYRKSKRLDIPLSQLADQDLLSDAIEYRRWKESNSR
jgi:hypothetical protein